MILEARNLRKEFKTAGVVAVDDISFSIAKGRTVGVVGESGSGKSTLAKLALRLLTPDAGQVLFHGEDITSFPARKLKDFRRKVQVVFQEPFLSLDPRMKIETILREPFLIHGGFPKERVRRKLTDLLSLVELPVSFLSKYPRELSGGECQRVAIARAVSLRPEVIVCDEAVSSLDALVQVQILNLLLKLQKKWGMAYLFISHDLRVIRHMSDEVLVMKEGKLCERGPREALFSAPQEAYTRTLLKGL